MRLLVPLIALTAPVVGCRQHESKPELYDSLPIFKTKVIASFSHAIEDMAVLSKDRVAVGVGSEVRVLDAKGKELEKLDFPDMVYSITPTVNKSDFMVTLADRTFWSRNGSGFEQIAEFGHYSLATSDVLIDDDKQVIYSGDGKVQVMNLTTKQKTLICDVDLVIGQVEHDKRNDLLYVGTISYKDVEQAEVICIDLRTRRVVWRVPSGDVAGLHALEKSVVVLESGGIRVLDQKDGSTLRGEEPELGITGAESEKQFVVFDRFALSPYWEAIIDLDSKGELKQIARLQYLSRSAAVTDSGLVFTNGLDYSELAVVDLSPLLKLVPSGPERR